MFVIILSNTDDKYDWIDKLFRNLGAKCENARPAFEKFAIHRQMSLIQTQLYAFKSWLFGVTVYV